MVPELKEYRELMDFLTRFEQNAYQSIQVLTQDLKDTEHLEKEIKNLSEKELKVRKLEQKDVEEALKQVGVQQIQLKECLLNAKNTHKNFLKLKEIVNFLNVKGEVESKEKTEQKENGKKNSTEVENFNS